ncbi:MAG TPA: hypothetical protein PLU43_09300, partial [Lachnospiraceae bacterium]|nr:hypothetical protein [Lachnospiraceae bacterium]
MRGRFVKKWFELTKKKQYVIISGIILFFFILIHIFKLDQIPYGYHIDEAGAAYDSYCLSYFGIDRYLNEFPVYL